MPDPADAYRPQPGKPATGAFLDLWKQRYRPAGGIPGIWVPAPDRIQCFKYARYIIIKTHIDLLGPEDRRKLDRYFAGKRIPDDIRWS